MDRILQSLSYVVRRAFPLQIAITLAAISCGCTRAIGFHVVDAATGAPLAGVATDRSSKSDDILLGSKRTSGNLAPSGDDGMVAARDLSGNMVHSFVFRKEGYRDAQVIWELPKAERVLYLSPSPGAHQAKFAEVSERGVVTVRMYSVNTKEP